MSKTSGSSLTFERGGNLAFIVVALTAYLSLFSAVAPNLPPLPTIAALVILGVVYSLNGIYGFAWCERSGSPWALMAYFIIQIALGAAVGGLGRGAGGWLLMLPLAAQSVAALPRNGMLAVCALIVAAFSASIGLVGNWTTALQAAAQYLAAVAFVAIFMQVVLNEQRARAEVERLAAELSNANRQLREYAMQAEELATVRERNRLAREIHDSLGHYLTAVNIQIEAARAVLAQDAVRALDALSKAQTLTKEGLSEVRRSVAALRASPIENRSLAEAIEALAGECRAAGIPIELIIKGEPRPLSPQVELALYRAAQEGLTNVRKHARASRAEVRLDYTDAARVRLTVQDNGIGSDELEGGFGLMGVRERVQLLGGQMTIRSAVGRGLTLDIELPE